MKTLGDVRRGTVDTVRAALSVFFIITLMMNTGEEVEVEVTDSSADEYESGSGDEALNEEEILEQERAKLEADKKAMLEDKVHRPSGVSGHRANLTLPTYLPTYLHACTHTYVHIYSPDCLALQFPQEMLQEEKERLMAEMEQRDKQLRERKQANEEMAAKIKVAPVFWHLCVLVIVCDSACVCDSA